MSDSNSSANLQVSCLTTPWMPSSKHDSAHLLISNPHRQTHIMFNFCHRKRLFTGLSHNGHRLVNALETLDVHRATLLSTKDSVSQESLPTFTTHWTIRLSDGRTEFAEIEKTLRGLHEQILCLAGGNSWLGKYARAGLLKEWGKQVVVQEVLKGLVEEMEVVWRCVYVEVTQMCIEHGVVDSEKSIVGEWDEMEEEL
ncbi:hypothetical protein BGX38DRAFT_1156198, partial [Terfezia claveryi]